MTSWRESASQQAQDDLDRLFNLALEHAARRLRNGRRLAPFAAAVADDGSAAVLAEPVPDTGSARAALDQLYAAVRAHAERYRAVGFTAVVTLDGAAAVRVEAEHRERVALALRVPYRQRFLGGVRYGTMRLSDGPARLWP